MLLIEQLQWNAPCLLAVHAALWALVLLLITGGGLMVIWSHEGLLLGVNSLHAVF